MSKSSMKVMTITTEGLSFAMFIELDLRVSLLSAAYPDPRGSVEDHESQSCNQYGYDFDLADEL